MAWVYASFIDLTFASIKGTASSSLFASISAGVSTSTSASKASLSITASTKTTWSISGTANSAIQKSLPPTWGVDTIPTSIAKKTATSATPIVAASRSSVTSDRIQQVATMEVPRVWDVSTKITGVSTTTMSVSTRPQPTSSASNDVRFIGSIHDERASSSSSVLSVANSFLTNQNL
jgi:hypothetical protein